MRMSNLTTTVLVIAGLVVLFCLVFGCGGYGGMEGLEPKMPQGGERTTAEVCSGFDNQVACEDSTQCMWDTGNSQCLPNPVDMTSTSTQMDATMYAE